MASSINSDNGVISGSSGLKSTADASGVLALQSNGTTGLTLNTSLAVGVGSSPSYGTSGQVLTSAGSAAPPAWSTLSTAPGVTNYSNQSVDVTLTSANANYLLSFTLANDITVTMPDATTLTSAKNFEIKNNSATYGIYVNDAAGNYIFSIPPQTDMRFWTTSVATAAGAWVTGSLPLPYVTGYTYDLPTLSYLADSNDYCSALNSTQAIQLFIYLNGLYAVVVTNTAGVISYGTAYYVGQPNSGTYVASIAALTSTTGVLVYADAIRTGYYIARGFTVSGTTITFGTPTIANTTTTYASTPFCTLAALSSTTAVFVFTSSGTATRGHILTLSGGSVTSGAEASFSSRTSSTPIQVTALSSALFVLTYVVSASTAGGAQACSVSGTTITVGTQQQLVRAESSLAVSATSATSFVFAGMSATGALLVQACTVSGTTVTAGTGVSFAASGGGNVAIAATSSTAAVVTWYSSSVFGPVGRTVGISGTTVTAGATTYTLFTNGSAINIAPLCLVGLQTIAVGTPNTSSLLSTTMTQNTVATGTTINQNLTISGSVITANTPNSYAVSTNNLTSQPMQRAAAISSTQIVRLTTLSSANGTASNLVARLYGVSGSTFTLQNTVTVSSSFLSTGIQYAIFPISSSLVGVYYINAAGAVAANTISISGTTMTVNTGITVDSAAVFTNVSGCAVSSSLLVVGYADVTTFVQSYRTISVSGTTLTANAAITYSSASGLNGPASLVPLSSTMVAGLFIHTRSAIPWQSTFSLTISGTSLTQNIISEYSLINSAGFSVWGITALSGTQAIYSIPYSSATNPQSPMRFALVIFDASGYGVMSNPLGYANTSYGNNSQFMSQIAATSATSGVVFGVGTGNEGPLLLGTWSLNGSTIVVNADKPNAFRFAQNCSNTSLHPLAAPAVGLQSANSFVLMANETASSYAPAAAQGVTLRKYSVAGTVNS